MIADEAVGDHAAREERLHVGAGVVRDDALLRPARGAVQEVHDVARDLATAIEARHPRVFTTEYRVARRPKRRVLLDHNQNAVGHHLAGAYSVRPKPHAPVSTPLEWEELTEGVRPRDFTMDVALQRVAERGDLFEPVLHVSQALGPALKELRG